MPQNASKMRFRYGETAGVWQKITSTLPGTKEEKDERQDGLRKVFAGDAVKGKVVKRADAVIIIGNNAAVQRIHDDMQNGGIENQRGEDAAACRESGERGVLQLCAVKGSADENENDDDCGGGQIALIQPQREKKGMDSRAHAPPRRRHKHPPRRTAGQVRKHPSTADRSRWKRRRVSCVTNEAESRAISVFVKPEKLCHQYAQKRNKNTVANRPMTGGTVISPQANRRAANSGRGWTDRPLDPAEVKLMASPLKQSE